MLTIRELATVRAALLYWQEEMCPHPADMPPYFEPATVEPLTADQTAVLRARFQPGAVRYLVVSLEDRDRLLATAEAALQMVGEPDSVASVIF